MSKILFWYSYLPSTEASRVKPLQVRYVNDRACYVTWVKNAENETVAANLFILAGFFVKCVADLNELLPNNRAFWKRVLFSNITIRHALPTTFVDNFKKYNILLRGLYFDINDQRHITNENFKNSLHATISAVNLGSICTRCWHQWHRHSLQPSRIRIHLRVINW